MKQSYELTEALKAIEHLDPDDSFEVLRELTLAYGVFDIVEWLNEIEGYSKGIHKAIYKVQIVDRNNGELIFP